MDSKEYIERIEGHGLRATAIRILVLEALSNAGRTLSMSDLEIILDTVDKSSIFRTLEAFERCHLVHTIDDGTGSVKYEVCGGKDGCSVADMHTHFYCESCHRTVCLTDITVPVVDLPAGYETHSINYIVKGLCPACSCSGRGHENPL